MLYRFTSRVVAKGAAVFAIVLLVSLGSPTQTLAQVEPAAQSAKANGNIDDPIESFNRLMFGFNELMDMMVLKPAAYGYRYVMPRPARNSVRNLINNLKSPVVLLNDLLQGENKRAHTTMSRFMLNSTIGVLGLFDVATSLGYPRHSEDFGQTLAVWGMGEGSYLVVPIFGPMTVRDAAGNIVDFFLDPLTYVAWENDHQEYFIGLNILDVVDRRERNIERIDQLKEDSFDYYATIRSLYVQNRRAEIRNQRVNENSFSSLPDYDFE